MNTDLRRRDGEEGVATVLAVAWIFVITTLAWIGMLAAAATARQHKVDGAADLVAVSAAARLQRGGDPCRTAAEIAVRNDVSLQTCRVDGDDVVVAVSDELLMAFEVRRRLIGQARAGPPRG